MRRIALAAALLLAAAACGQNQVPVTGSTAVGPTSAPDLAFPVTVTDSTGAVTIATMPASIISLSTTATEMLFAVGAGNQVIAVDEYSTYPDEAPRTSLSGFTPNIEAILGYDPDLVIISFDPGELRSSLEAAGVPSLILTTANSLDDTYEQIRTIGIVTGHAAEADSTIARMVEDIGEVINGTVLPAGVTFYHEVDSTLYSASSTSYLGQVYALLGLENIADGVEDPGGFGFPQLSSEYIVNRDPDIIFLGDVDFGVTPESLVDRPGWSGMKAVREGAIVGLDSYLASNWGPRVVEFLRVVAEAAALHAPAA